MSGPQSIKLTMYNASLPADMTDLYELTQLAGMTFDPQVFRIVVELLRLNVAPTAIERMLKSMCLQHQKHHQRQPDLPDSARSNSSARSAPLR